MMRPRPALPSGSFNSEIIIFKKLENKRIFKNNGHVEERKQSFAHLEFGVKLTKSSYPASEEDRHDYHQIEDE